MKSNQCVLGLMCTLSCEIGPHEQIFFRKTLIRIFEHNFGLWPSVWPAVVWIPIGRGEQGFFFAVWSTSKPIKLFEMFAYVTLPNGV